MPKKNGVPKNVRSLRKKIECQVYLHMQKRKEQSKCKNLKKSLSSKQWKKKSKTQKQKKPNLTKQQKEAKLYNNPIKQD